MPCEAKKFLADRIDRMLQFNQAVTFGSGGIAREYCISGVSFDDSPEYSWTVEQTVHFDIKLPIPRSEVALEIVAFPFIHQERVPVQQLYVYFNGLFQGFDSLADQKAVRLDLMRSAFSPRGNKLTFVIPTARSPNEVGLGADIRTLGLALSAINFIAV